MVSSAWSLGVGSGADMSTATTRGRARVALCVKSEKKRRRQGDDSTGRRRAMGTDK